MNKNSSLGAMMFLQYALWGAWLPVTARYLSASVIDGGLGFSGSQIGMILGLAGSIGAIALNRSGFFKPIFKLPYPPIEMPVKRVCSGFIETPYSSAAHFGNSLVTKVSQVP